MISGDNIAGAVYGLALGDALGRDTEFMKLKAIHRAYGDRGYMPLPHPALFTDDTQMTIAAARALAGARSITPRELVRTFTNEFTYWARHDEPRAPGVTCMSSIHRLNVARKYHKSWTTATNPRSKGCGANMRVLPTALMKDMDTAIGVSQLQAALTHGHPTAIAATELTALAMRWAAEGVDLIELPSMLRQRAITQRNVYRQDWIGNLKLYWPGEANALRNSWQHMELVMKNVDSALSRNGHIKNVCAVLGGAWVAEEALATALYFAVRYRDDPTYAISMAARTDGDSDSIACITGAIVGARYGVDVWPAEWANRIERIHDLEWMIEYLTAQYM